MAEPEVSDHDWAFLRGGGEMGARIADFDWAPTATGPIEGWPQGLKAALSLMLQSPVPIMLLWGEDGIIFHNDAYAPLMGARNHHVLGAPALEAWPHHAALIGRFLDASLSGRTLSFRNRQLMVDRSGHRELAWFDLDCSPVRDDRGEPAGGLIISVETTQRVLAERKAARKLETQRAMFEQAPGVVCLMSGPDLIVEFTNAAHRRMFGVHDAEGRPYMEAFAEVAALGDPEILFEAYRSGERLLGRAEPMLIPRPGGQVETRLLDFVLEPVFDDEGNVRGLFFEGFEVTEQVRAQRDAQESSRRLGAALSLARLGAFDWESETNTMTIDARAQEIFGFAPDEPVTREEMIARIDPEDFRRLQTEADAAEAAGRSRREYEFRVRRPDGTVRNVASISDGSWPRNERGRFTGVLDDVTERRAAERRQRMLINELNHRVKNTLATVQSIAAQTLRAAPSLAVARGDFESRLVALSGAHDLLTAQGWRGAPLEDVTATALAAFESLQRPQIRRGGPHVWLAAQQALALNLALHELATNAAKYGALSVAEGRVDISWSQRGEELTLLWLERGGPPVADCARTGFGARLLQRSLARELGGQVDWEFRTEGVRCEIRFRVGQPAAASPLEVLEAAAARFDF